MTPHDDAEAYLGMFGCTALTFTSLSGDWGLCIQTLLMGEAQLAAKGAQLFTYAQQLLDS